MKTCAQEGFQVGSTCAKFTGEMRFFVGSKGYRHTNTNRHTKTNSPCQKYIWDPLQEIHTQALIVKPVDCCSRTWLYCMRVLYTIYTYIAYMMHTNNMYMTIILLGMHVCFVYGEDQRCPHPCMRIVPFL